MSIDHEFVVVNLCFSNFSSQSEEHFSISRFFLPVSNPDEQSSLGGSRNRLRNGLHFRFVPDALFQLISIHLNGQPAQREFISQSVRGANNKRRLGDARKMSTS